MGMASSRSSPLPWGTPSMMSMSTTSASSLPAIQWAAVAPTLPAPTTVTFLRMGNSFRRSDFGLHVFDHVAGELAGANFGGARHQPLEIVSNFFLLDGALERFFNQARGLFPAHEVEHHDAGENHRARVDDVFIGVLGRGAVGGLEDGVFVADVAAGSDA